MTTAAAAGQLQTMQPAASGGGVAATLDASTPPNAAKLKTLHVDPVPSHKLAEGSFWKVADPVAKPFKGEYECSCILLPSCKPRPINWHEWL